jgi:hypothetical protein
VDVWWVLKVPREERPGLRYSHYFNVVGRVRMDAGRAAIEEDLRRTAASVAKRYPSPNSPWRSSVVPLKDEIIGTVDSTLLVLAGAAAAVLLLACVNIAGLLLGRASARTREVGVRSALGATRGRLARQLLIESVVLAVAGGALGVGLAYAAIAAVVRFGPADMPRLQMIGINPQVLLFIVAITVASAAILRLVTIASVSPGMPNGSCQCFSVNPCHTKLNLLFVSLNENRMMIPIGNSRYRSTSPA